MRCSTYLHSRHTHSTFSYLLITCFLPISCPIPVLNIWYYIGRANDRDVHTYISMCAYVSACGCLCVLACGFLVFRGCHPRRSMTLSFPPTFGFLCSLGVDPPLRLWFCGCPSWIKANSMAWHNSDSI